MVAVLNADPQQMQPDNQLVNFSLAEICHARSQVSPSYNKSKYPGEKKSDHLPTAPVAHSAITLAHLKGGSFKSCLSF